MTCNDAINEIPNYCYGEIASDTEEALESHVAECEACRGELAKHRRYLELLDERETVPDAGLLLECRSSLSAVLRQDQLPAKPSIVDRLQDLFTTQIPFRVPIGAMALVAVGFFGARYTPEKFGGVRAALAEPLFSNVRSIEPESSGQVRIAVDEVRRHVVSGSVQDPQIRELVVSGVTDGSNPLVRLRSIQVMGTSGAESDQVRVALTGALQHDPSAAVRMKALEGLKQFAGDPAVRSALASVVQTDNDANVRIQAIGLLAAHSDGSIVGALQNAVQKEDNPIVRAQMVNLLANLGASPGTY